MFGQFAMKAEETSASSMKSSKPSVTQIQTLSMYWWMLHPTIRDQHCCETGHEHLVRQGRQTGGREAKAYFALLHTHTEEVSWSSWASPWPV